MKQKNFMTRGQWAKEENKFMTGGDGGVSQKNILYDEEGLGVQTP